VSLLVPYSIPAVCGIKYDAGLIGDHVMFTLVQAIPGPKRLTKGNDEGPASLGDDFPQYAMMCFDGCHDTVGEGPKVLSL
jgi:hypothetical protein